MKRILCVAVLLGITTALHAVTYNWNKDTKAFTDTDGNKLQAYKDISKLVITVNCKGTSNTITHDFFAITQTDGKNLLKFGVNGQRAQITVTNSNVISGQGHWSAARAGENKLFTTVFTFKTLTDGVFKGLDADYTFTSDSAKTERDYWTSSLSNNFNGLSFDKLEAFTGTEIISATIDIDGTPVPEPGLLALLALGGAGLVLRRKVQA